MKEKIKWTIQSWKISDLKPYKKNPRIFTESGLKDLKKSIKQIGFAQLININIDGTILSGHARYKFLIEEKIDKVDVFVPNRKLSEKEEEEVVVRLNKNIAGVWDLEALNSQFEFNDLLDWGFLENELINIDLTKQENEDESKYTKKIEIPIYEPKGIKPKISELTELNKTHELIQEIENSTLKKELKEFLKLSAYRHIKFNYSKIAEFYAHLQEEEKKFFERSALVLIDFDNAIENGFVEMIGKLKETTYEK